MATKKDIIKLTDKDFEAKSFKTAPGGTYTFKPNKSQSKIKPGTTSNIMQLCLTISKGPHKGVNVFDNIAPHVGWKIAQLLKAIGITKKQAKKYKTIQDILKLILAQKEIRIVIREKKSAEFGKQNKIVQYLPPGAEADEEDDDVEEDEDEEDEEEDEDSDSDEEEDEEADEEDDEEEEDEEDDEDEEESDDEDDSEEEDDEDEDEEEDDEDEEEVEEDEDEEEEEEEEEEAPKKKKKTPAKKKAPARGKARSKKKK